jgi:hypothetical protein
MKQFLLFAGQPGADAPGVRGLVGDFDSFAEAFVALVDRQLPSDWWHVLDTRTGEVVERRHLKINNGMIGFQRSDWLVGQPAGAEEPITLPLPAPAGAEPKLPEIDAIEADLRTVLTNGLKSSHVNGKANRHAEGAGTGH